MSDLSKQAGILSATEFFRFFVKTLIGIALARLITPAELGSYRQLFLIYSTFSTLLLLGIPQSMLYFLPKAQSEAEQKRIISRTLNIVSLLALVFALAILLLRGFIAAKFNNPALEKLFLFYAIYPLFMFVTQVYSSIMLGLKAPLKAARFTIFAILCDFILILGVAFITRSLFLIVWAVILSALLQWLYASIKLWSYHKQQLPWDFGGLKAQLAYCLPLGLSSIIGMLSIQLDKFMISGFFTPEQFAVFSVGAMELPLVGILSNSINSILLPNMSTGNVEQIGEIFKGAVRKNALIVFPLTALFYMFAEPMMIFLYGKLYLDAAIYFKIYLLVLPLRVATYGIVFQAFGKTKVILHLALFTLFSNVVLNYFLIKAMGMQGAAYATVIVTWLTAIIYLALMKTSLRLKLKNFFPVNKLLLTALSIALPMLVCIPVVQAIQPQILSVVLGTMLLGILYLLCGRVFGAILPYDIQFIGNIFKAVKRKILP